MRRFAAWQKAGLEPGTSGVQAYYRAGAAGRRRPPRRRTRRAPHGTPAHARSREGPVGRMRAGRPAARPARSRCAARARSRFAWPGAHPRWEGGRARGSARAPRTRGRGSCCA